jgi:hypothetical protein
LLTVVVPISLLRGLPWLPLSSLMSVLSDLFVPQTDFPRAHSDATFDARLSTLPTPRFEILNHTPDSEEPISASAFQRMVWSDAWKARL